MLHASTYLGVCSLTIALLVFLNSTQPFVLTEVYGVVDRAGSISSTLALADELTVLLTAPIWGHLSDLWGVKIVTVAGFVLMAAGIALYPLVPAVYPWLVMARVIFALGAGGCVSMVAAILSNLVKSSGQDEPGEQTKKSSHMAGLAGLAAGLGALFAVAVLLPLPTQFGFDDNPISALRSSFIAVAATTMALQVVVIAGLPPTQIIAVSESNIGFLQTGITLLKTEKQLQLAFAGSLVARASSVVLSLFVPLMVNSWYVKTGRCPSGEGCRDGIVKAAVITGIANTTALVAAPAWGWIGRRSLRMVVASSSLAGAASMICLSSLQTMLGIWPILICSLLAISQVGVMTSSLAMCGNHRGSRPGSIAGVYALSGSIGIIVVTQVGGRLADIWIKAPFVVLTSMFIGLASLVALREWECMRSPVDETNAETQTETNPLL